MKKKIPVCPQCKEQTVWQPYGYTCAFCGWTKYFKTITTPAQPGKGE